MRRIYTDTAHFHAPFDSPNLSLSGYPDTWSPRRTYWSVHDFRAPYRGGFFQDGSLQGDAPAAATLWKIAGLTMIGAVATGVAMAASDRSRIANKAVVPLGTATALVALVGLVAGQGAKQ